MANVTVMQAEPTIRLDLSLNEAIFLVVLTGALTKNKLKEILQHTYACKRYAEIAQTAFEKGTLYDIYDALNDVIEKLVF